MTEQQMPGNQPGPHYYSPPPQPGQVRKRKAPTWDTNRQRDG